MEPPKTRENAPFFLPTVHRKGSADPSFPTPEEYVKIAKNTDLAGDIGKKRKFEDEIKIDESPSEVAQALASMGSAWEDADTFGSDDGEGSNGEDHPWCSGLPEDNRKTFSSHIIKSKNRREGTGFSRYYFQVMSTCLTSSIF